MSTTTCSCGYITEIGYFQPENVDISGAMHVPKGLYLKYGSFTGTSCPFTIYTFTV